MAAGAGKTADPESQAGVAEPVSLGAPFFGPVATVWPPFDGDPRCWITCPQSGRREGVRSLEHLALIRRVLAVATAP
jgi:hypothetical protein